MARTNIVLDDKLIAQAMQLTGTKTKKAAVEIALRRLVDQAESFQALRAMRGRAPWDGDLDQWRRDCE